MPALSKVIDSVASSEIEYIPVRDNSRRRTSPLLSVSSVELKIVALSDPFLLTIETETVQKMLSGVKL